MAPIRPAMFFLIGTVHLTPDIKVPIPVDPGNPGSYQRFMWNATHNPFELTEVADWYECITIDYPACTFEAGYSHNVGRTNLRAAIAGRPGPFVLAGVSQGAGVISHVYNDLRTGDMQDRRADLIRGLAVGNPWRQVGRSLPIANVLNPTGHGMAADNLVGTEDLWWELAAHGDIVCTNEDDAFSQLVTAVYEWTYANYTGSADALASAATAYFSGHPAEEVIKAVNSWLRVFTNLNAQTNPHLAYMDYKPVIGDDRTGIEIATADLIALAKTMGVGPSAAAIGWFAETFITLNGIPSAEAIGSPAISSGQGVRLVGIPSAEAIGTPKLVKQQFIKLNGIPSAEAIGQINFSWLQEITLSGVASAEAVGVPSLTGNKVITLDGISSAEAFGQLKLGQNVRLVGIPTQQGFGAPNLIPGSVSIRLNGIPSAEAIGQPIVVPPTPPFTPISELNVARTNYPIPVGATQVRIKKMIGGGASGGTGLGAGGGDRGGGSGGGGAAVIDEYVIPISAFGSSVYSTAIGAAGAPSGNAGALGGAENGNDGGDTIFQAGSVQLIARGGKRGLAGTAVASVGGGAGGTWSATGVTGVPGSNGSAGGTGGLASGGAGGAAPNNTAGGCPGGGGGCGISGLGVYGNGGSGGNSIESSGGAGGTSNGTTTAATGDTGSSSSTGPGGGGGGSGTGSGYAEVRGGHAGNYGAGSGGSCAGNNQTLTSGNAGTGRLWIIWE